MNAAKTSAEKCILLEKMNDLSGKQSPIRDSASVSTPVYNLIITRKPIFKLRIMLVGSYGLVS